MRASLPFPWRRRASSIVLSAVVVGVAAFFVWPEDDAAGVEIPTLIDLAPDEVRRITVVNDKGERAVLVNKGDKEWDPADGTPSINRTLMFDIEERILPLQAYRKLTRLDVDKPVYGLDDPEITVTVQSVAGKKHTVELGQQTFNTGGFYARVVGSDVVYLVPRRPMDDLRSLAAGERIDTPTRVDEKLGELEEKQLDQVDRSETSPWLEQVLETGGAVDEVEDPSERSGPTEDVEEDLLDDD